MKINKLYKIKLPKFSRVTKANFDIDNGFVVADIELEKIEQKYEPKDGDFIHLKWEVIKTFLPYEKEEREAIAIFNEIDKTNNNSLYCYVTYFVGDDFKDRPILMMPFDYNGNKLSNGYTSTFGEIRPATEREKKLLIEKLAEVGKRWNPETKSIEDVRWRADYGGTYYFVDKFIKASPHNDCRFGDNNFDYTSGNYFKTREAAEKVAEQIREIFQNSKSE